jgi:hypothetical protein
MPRLHALLAVESSLKTQANAARSDLANTFDKKKHHFTETRTTFKPYAENEPDVVEQQLDLQTTVPGEIEWLTPFLVKAIDAGYQVDEANSVARADVVLEDGRTLLTGLPATALMQIEKRLNELHEFVTQIPTLDPSKGFREDPDFSKPYVYKARDVQNPRTKKETKHIVVVPPTDRHPAQVVSSVEDVPIGMILKQEWSGLITPARKGLFIERVEELTRAVKQARSRANEIEVETKKLQIGATLLGYVFAS